MSALSIVIVSWNVQQLLRTSLHSIFAHADGLELDVIVVDSASADGTVAMVENEFPQVNVLAQAKNVGFARGNNIGIAAATAPNILLLNPDTEVVGNALSEMVAFLEQNNDVGIVGSELLNRDMTHQSSRRRFPTVWTLFFESTWLQRVAPKSILRRYYMWETADHTTTDCDWVSGACMLTRRDVIEQVGGFDEAYFMYSEEMDWCRRIKDVGWRIVYYPAAKIIHHVGKSSEQAVAHRHINFNRAKLRYVRKYHGRFPYLALRVFLLFNYIQQIEIELFKGILGHKRPLRWQRIGVYWQVLRSGLSAAGY